MLLPPLLLVGGVAEGCDVLLELSLAAAELFTAAVDWLEEVVLVVEAVAGAGPLPLAKEERAEATAAEAAWARPPARLPLMAPIIGGGGGAGIRVAGSMLQKM